jgi:putative MFS transporter
MKSCRAECGVVGAILLADRVGMIRLQVWGFVGCAAGLFLASLSSFFTGHTHIVFIFLGFMLFNFMTNLGPNAQTCLLAGEVFPTSIRGKSAGFAAAFAKVGAVLTAFLFPTLLRISERGCFSTSWWERPCLAPLSPGSSGSRPSASTLNF